MAIINRLHDVDADIVDSDVCIIGGGPVGLALAARLSGTNIKCIILESGEVDVGDAQSLADGENSGLYYFDLEDTRIRAIGGTTHVWGGNSAPFSPLDFEKRDWVPYSGWPISFDEYYRYVPDACDLLALHRNWSHRENPGRILLDRDDLFFDWKLFQLSPVINSEARRAKGNFYQYNKEKIDAEIISDATVVACKFSGDGSVSSLQVSSFDRQKSVQVKAKVNVLCCGGIENARQLLLMKRFENSPFLENDNIGRFFMEHPHPSFGKLIQKTQIPAEINYTGFRLNQAVGVYRPFLKETLQRQKELQAGNFQLILSKKRNGLVGLFEQAPNPSSRVTLSTRVKDNFDLAGTELHYDIYDHEYRHFFTSAIYIARELGARGLARVNFSNLRPDKYVKKEHFLGGGHHHMGTTRMGISKTDAVVDKDCKIFDAKNLYVAGASVFSTSGSVNPTMNAIALALRLADHIKKEL